MARSSYRRVKRTKAPRRIPRPKTKRDRFTDLPVSRQRKWQLRALRLNRCCVCKGRRLIDSSYCLRHWLLRELTHRGALPHVNARPVVLARERRAFRLTLVTWIIARMLGIRWGSVPRATDTLEVAMALGRSFNLQGHLRAGQQARLLEAILTWEGTLPQRMEK